MDDEIFISFGIPKHGWLPVIFRHKDFSLDFDASDVLNDPIEELFNATILLEANETKTVTWWLEPVAYLFNFENKEQSLTLTIIEKEGLHKESSNEKRLTVINGDKNKLLNRFRDALREFARQKYEEQDWPYYLGRNKIEKL
ncbi:MAG: hypothetical protein KF746_23030 [Chitinophagaceae bacterium]|nr:hypothetical protein [Chitinophagaceae bacterium]